jgi:hypothetical protein
MSLCVSLAALPCFQNYHIPPLPTQGTFRRRCLAISLSASRSATRQCPVPASWFAKSLHASILEARQTDLPAKNMRIGLCGWAKFMRHHPAHTVPADPRPAAGYGVCRLPSAPNLSLSHWPLRAQPLRRFPIMVSWWGGCASCHACGWAAGVASLALH